MKTQTPEQTNAAAIEDVKAIFEEWDDERNRAFALVSAIEQLLHPEPNEDGPEFNAWKLAQVALDSILANTSAVNEFKRHWGLFSQV